MEPWVIIALFGSVVLFGIALLLWPSLYVTVPSSEVMVRTTRAAKNEPSFFKEGRALVIPLYHRYSILGMHPMKVLFNHPTFLDQNNIRLKIKILFTFAISEEHESIIIAARRFAGLNSSQIEEMASEIFLGELRNTVSVMSVEQIIEHRDSFIDLLYRNIDPELNKSGLYLMNCKIADITDDSGHVEGAIAKKQAKDAEREKVKSELSDRYPHNSELRELLQRELSNEPLGNDTNENPRSTPNQENPVEIPQRVIFKFDFKDMPTKQDILLNIDINIAVGASDDQQFLQNGMKALSGRSPLEIEQIARDMVSQDFASAIEMITIEDINRDREWFLKHCADIVGERLKEIGMDVVFFKVIDITDDSGWIERAGQRALAEAQRNKERTK
tara:strand:+ start:68619 stop:69782 length:1164 start_codon:yes stop_codon:yes gene_type:complete